MVSSDGRSKRFDRLSTPGRLSLVILAFALASGCSDPQVELGLDRVASYSELFRGQRIGIITNHTGYNSQGEHITDVFWKMNGVSVTALFGPEHGIRGSAEDGAKIDSARDPVRQIPIYSLYGQTRKPTPEMLANVDVLVFDIQDIGARFYTYIYTMALAMEAAAEQDKRFVVLDRPNPIAGKKVEGNVLDPAFATFVGLYPIPVRHGMTAGELARMFNGEGWLANGVTAELSVVPLSGWQRDMWYDETGLRFIPPSPNMPDLETATAYPGLCLLEGTNVSEGRGTTTPFLSFGAPWIDSRQLVSRLNDLDLEGVKFLATSFTPQTMPGKALHPKYEGYECFGTSVQVTDREHFQPYWTGIQVVDTIHRLYPDSLQWRIKHFDRLCGTDKVRNAIENNADLLALRAAWQDGLTDFMLIRQKYLIYD